MDQRLIDIIRYSFLGIALLVGSLFVHKHYRRHVVKKEIVAELQTLTSDSSFYRQFEADDAKATLLRCVALMHQAESLGLPPAELYDRIYKRDGLGSFGDEEPSDYPIREELVRDTLDSAYDAANRLELLEPALVSDLRDGRMPIMATGTPVILPLIDPEIAPGLGKIIPNLEILPAGRAGRERELTAIERAAARGLARKMASAGLIENSVADTITNHYESLKSVPADGETAAP